MKANLILLAALMIVSKACSNNSEEDKPRLSKDTVVEDSSLVSLVEDVLSLPAVVKLSKADFIRKQYGTLYVSLTNENSKIRDSVLYQVGLPIKVIKDDKALSNSPCYVFEKIEMQGNSAYIEMKFAITGFVCRGKLNYIDGRWVAEKAFLVGYQ